MSDNSRENKGAGSPVPSNRLVHFAWFVVAYMIAVILWGAWVRITGSGAGCGDHWPLCDGEAIPRAPTTEKLIEYIHRVSSGLSGFLGLGLLVWVRRAMPQGHRSGRAAAVALGFLIAEGALGAGLVKFELVANDDSVARAIAICLHLVNTMGLMAGYALTAWWLGRPSTVGIANISPRKKDAALLLAGLLGLILVGMTGAITALGDTLFPPDTAGGVSLVERIEAELSPAMHFLVRLRIIHPIVASLVALYIALLAASQLQRSQTAKHVAAWALGLVVIQVGAGLLNIALKAPGYLQLTHLFIANLLWVALLLLSAETLRPSAHT
ncbi:MAG: COX15/CtaA family protein [Myxococcota bacterium]|nr:COX15/CtaA family protein [Myxococcota bacterium]